MLKRNDTPHKNTDPARKCVACHDNFNPVDNSHGTIFLTFPQANYVFDEKHIKIGHDDLEHVRI